jgi:diguanylate cyclase (GGDEF)-like protein
MTVMFGALYQEFLKYFCLIFMYRFWSDIPSVHSKDDIYLPSNIRQLLGILVVKDDNRDLTLAQYAAFSKQIPLLYITLLVNSWGLAYSFMKVAPPVLAFYVPCVLTLVCAARIVAWCLTIGKQPSVEVALHALRRTTGLSGLLAFLFGSWALCLFSYGDAYAKGHVLFFMGITVVGCVFCLMHLRPAALRVMLVVNTMFVAFFVSTGNMIFIAISLNIVLVSAVMATVLWVYYSGFVDLIDSRRALREQQAETQALSDENYRLANVDSLTGLPNRRHFFAELETTLEQVVTEGQVAAVGIIDLDGFKAINDGYGHAAGDCLLSAVAARLSDRQASDFIVCRLGGDEFGLIVKGVGSERDLVLIGTEICQEILLPIGLAEGTVLASASIGFAFIAPAADRVNDAFENADYALYDAKKTGKRKAVVFTPAHRAEIRTASRIERALEQPGFENELSVEYQPIVDVDQGRVVAFEALARWNSPELGKVPPSVFIPAAERSGLIGRLTAVLLAKSLETAKEWPDDIRLSFNLSANDIASSESMTRLLSVISRSGINPRRIDFEITETATLTDLEQAKSAIGLLKRWGVGISLDDFGTGYSSLSQVHQLALDTIKIDRSFVTDITTNPTSFKIVKSVLALSRDMEVACIVEGVETAEVLELLRTLGCSLIQGYHVSRPMKPGDLQGYLQRADVSRLGMPRPTSGAA